MYRPKPSPDQSVLEGLNTIRQHPDDYLCLVNEKDQFCGIVSASDLASCFDPQSLAPSKTLSANQSMQQALQETEQRFQQLASSVDVAF